MTTSDPELALVPGEELVRIRTGDWHLLVPMRFVERVHAAALPAVRPAAEGCTAPVVAVGPDLVPVVFAGALLGATEVALAPEHQLIQLRTRRGRALLWVDAVEEVLAHAPADPPPGGARAGLVAGWSAAPRPLAILDVPRVLELAS